MYFEFCLHEMADPAKALRHACTLASEVVIFDHAAASERSFYAGEDEKVRRSAQALESLGIVRGEGFSTVQRFADFAELQAKLRGRDALALERAQRFADVKEIVIKMPCELALLNSEQCKS